MFYPSGFNFWQVEKKGHQWSEAAQKVDVPDIFICGTKTEGRSIITPAFILSRPTN
jgi:hypothetical protein